MLVATSERPPGLWSDSPEEASTYGLRSAVVFEL